MNILTKVNTVNNIVEVRKKIEELVSEGYQRDNLFVLTHNKERTEHISDNTDAGTIGVAEEGVITAIANLFRSQGDELRAKLTAMGVSKEHAEQLEGEMDHGKIVILAWSGTSYEGDNFDDSISYYPPYTPMY
ncbi:General stress protein 17M [compost metagenome]